VSAHCANNINTPTLKQVVKLAGTYGSVFERVETIDFLEQCPVAVPVGYSAYQPIPGNLWYPDVK
jgi:hypothetical protein